MTSSTPPFSCPLIPRKPGAPKPNEMQNIGLTTNVLRGLSTKTVSSRRKVGLQAADELFDSALLEVIDENNVPHSALGEPLLSELVRLRYLGRPPRELSIQTIRKSKSSHIECYRFADAAAYKGTSSRQDKAMSVEISSTVDEA